MNNIEGFVLIGGRSTRLGVDKGLVQFGNTTLAARAVNTVTTLLSPEPVRLVAASEDQFDALDLPVGVPIIYDRHKDHGTFGAIDAALNEARSEWILVMACDYPFVSVELLKFLAGWIGDEYNAVVPVQPDGRTQPLCAFYRVEPWRDVIEEVIQIGGKLPPLRSTFDDSTTRYVKFEEIKDLAGAEDMFLNINFPRDLQKALGISSEFSIEM